MIPSKMLAFAFWELRRILNAISDDGWADWRAMALLICTQAGLVFSVLGLGSVILGRRLIPTHEPETTVLGVLLAVAITAINVSVMHRPS